MKVDHYRENAKSGMEKFSAKLVNAEAELSKHSSFFNKDVISNGIYRVSTQEPKIYLNSDIRECLLDKKVGKKLDHSVSDEQSFIMLYDKLLSKLCPKIDEMDSQVQALHKAQKKMEAQLTKITRLHQEDQNFQMVTEFFKNCSKMVGN